MNKVPLIDVPFEVNHGIKLWNTARRLCYKPGNFFYFFEFGLFMQVFRKKEKKTISS